MLDPNPPIPPPEPSPDWSVLADELRCPRCGYNLRMLTVPRCPECGLTFSWTDLIETHRARRSWLFEHNWRRAPIRSYLGTLFRALRPRSFWQCVTIHSPISPGALWFMLLTAPLVCFVSLVALSFAAGLIALLVAVITDDIPGTRAANVCWLMRDLCKNLFDLTAVPFTTDTLVARLAALLGPIAISAAVLCGLRQSLAKRRVRAVQVLRVVAYAALAAQVWWAAIGVAAYAGMGFIIALHMVVRVPSWIRASRPALVPLGLVAATLAYGLLLAAGWRRYLQLPRGPLVGLAAAVIGVLATMTAFAVTVCILYS